METPRVGNEGTNNGVIAASVDTVNIINIKEVPSLISELVEKLSELDDLDDDDDFATSRRCEGKRPRYHSRKENRQNERFSTLRHM